VLLQCAVAKPYRWEQGQQRASNSRRAGIGKQVDVQASAVRPLWAESCSSGIQPVHTASRNCWTCVCLISLVFSRP
jgi:hypothetical protein